MGGSYSKTNAKLEKMFWEGKSEIKVAKRRLKYPCSICEKPIVKGEKYLSERRFVGFGWLIRYTHLKCLEEVDK